jgi:hypothetical protein
MRVFIFTKKGDALGALDDIANFAAPDSLNKHSPGSGDISYLDLAGLTAADSKKALAHLKKRCAGSAWGIIDPRENKDPAAWFFEGASDYIGPGALKAAGVKRFKTAAAWRGYTVEAGAGAAKETAKTDFNHGIKLSAGKFPGWKTLTPGKTIQTYLLYVSLQGKTALGSRIGEAAHTQINKRLLTYVYQNFQEADGLVWMDTGKDCLLLIPPKAACANAAVAACFRMIISAPLIALETLGLTVPANFVCALHFGSVTYKPPGKTGTVVSDAVNHVFHLGAKRAEAGRLTITSEVPDLTVPEGLKDMFADAGVFEGRSLLQSRKFSYPKPWV